MARSSNFAKDLDSRTLLLPKISGEEQLNPWPARFNRSQCFYIQSLYLTANRYASLVVKLAYCLFLRKGLGQHLSLDTGPKTSHYK